MIRILIIDDQTMVRADLATIVGSGRGAGGADGAG